MSIVYNEKLGSVSIKVNYAPIIRKIATSISLAGISSLTAAPATAVNNNYYPAITDATLIYYLNNPKNATVARYDAKDSAGNAMQSPSILQVNGLAYKYVAVYHTPYAVSGGTHYKINLAGSNDLTNWAFIRALVDDADNPRVVRVEDSNYILLTHEQWLGAGATSNSPCQVKYELFYNESDLYNGLYAHLGYPPSFKAISMEPLVSTMPIL